MGIGHTRWATHGEPTDANAHPHVDTAHHVAVVHNGIIENASELRATVLADVVFTSQTDTEVLAHLIAAQPEAELEDAVRAALLLVEGAYGIAVVDLRHPDRIVVARNGSPVLLGIGKGEHFVASDASALVRHTDQVVYLDDREMAVLEADGFRTFTLDAEHTEKRPTTAPVSKTAYDKAGHADYMHKEIHEQPVAVERALSGRIDRRFATAHLGGHRALATRRPGAATHQGPRLRLRLLCRPRRRPAHREPHPHPGRCRGRVGVPLPQPGDRGGHPLHRDQPVG